jgi:hypothetical protein
MTTPRYSFPDLNSLPDDIKARIQEVQDKSGFIPNVFLALARRPAEWRAFLPTTMPSCSKKTAT